MNRGYYSRWELKVESCSEVVLWEEWRGYTYILCTNYFFIWSSSVVTLLIANSKIDNLDCNPQAKYRLDPFPRAGLGLRVTSVSYSSELQFAIRTSQF